MLEKPEPYVDIRADAVHIGGDVVGRDKIVQTTNIGYTVEQVGTLLTQITTSFHPKSFDGRSPYKGLDAFEEDDAVRFFGRESLVASLVERVCGARSIIITGPSGSGKSSLVRAGLIHTLRQGGLPGSERWLYAILKPGRNPLEQLALAMARLTRSPEAFDYIHRMTPSDPTALHKQVETILSDRRDQRAVLVVDQFEEIFTQVAREEERAAFLSALIHAATVDGGRVTVLFVMRSDFVANCATYPQLNGLLNLQFLQVGAMQPDELVSAIARPALDVGLRIDPALVTQVVNDVRDEPGALPLMQFALKDLFDAQQASGELVALTLADYLVRGGLHRALERYANGVFGSLSQGEQALARTVFGGLIEVGPGMADTRRTAYVDELVPVGVERAAVENVVQRLADARLLTTDDADARARAVTLAHERLIDAWGWLRRLVDENREAIALQNQITEDAQAWEQRRRDPSYLYSGARLATAQEQVSTARIVLGGLAQAFVDAGSATWEVARRRRQRSMRLLISGLVTVTVVLAGLTGWALISQKQALQQRDMAERQARIARSRQLVTQAISRLDDDLGLALLLSVEAVRVEDIFEARSILLAGLWHNIPLTSFLPGHTALVSSVAFSPDGQTLASGGDDGTIILWDVSDPSTPVARGAPLTGHADQVYSVAFSPDGQIPLCQGMIGHSRV